ncbi:MAG: tetratricopeptide repeat protein [Myxococcota bacterium]
MAEDPRSDSSGEAQPETPRAPSVEDTLAAASPGVKPSAEAPGMAKTMLGPATGSPALEDTLAPAPKGPPELAATMAGPSIGLDATMAGAARATPTPKADTEGARILEQGDPIDRYVVLSKLGMGGMGVVYAAYDPELDRKVAIKLMLPGRRNDAEATEGRTRLLREAQALARLNHPNVVSVHDVGTFDRSVWIAMEFVEGQTIGDWVAAAPRSWMEILAIMQQAGEGLQAAHEANLLHRDFKPDNVMVGADGRVRVMDFGLARGDGPREVNDDIRSSASLSGVATSSSLDTEMTEGNALLGTPAYMSAEQWRQEDVDARSDQFSFCVTLWELLYGERPFEGNSIPNLMCAVLDDERRPPPSDRAAPTWLRRVCERGLAPLPKQRYPDMAALLAAMDQARVRRRIRRGALAVGVLALGVGGVYAKQRIDHAQRVAACEESGESIRALWNDDVRARVDQSFAATGQTHAPAVAERVGPWLDDYAEGWRSAQTQACMASEVEHEWNDDTRARAQWCLDDHRVQLEALVEVLVDADASLLSRAVDMAAVLPRSAACVDEAALARSPPPPGPEIADASRELRDELARVKVSYDAGDYPRGHELVAPAVERAEALGWAPLSAQAHRLRGKLSSATDDDEAAAEEGTLAYMQAAESGAWGVASVAAVDMVMFVGYGLRKPAEAKGWVRDAQLAIGFAGDPSGLLNAQLVNNRAMVEARAGNREGALELFEETLRLRTEGFGPDHPKLAGSINNIATMHYRFGRYEQAEPLYLRSIEISVANLGPQHPNVALKYNNLGRMYTKSEQYDQARDALERALQIRRQSLPADHEDIGQTQHNLARLYLRRKEFEAAKAAAEGAVAIRRKDPERMALESSLMVRVTVEKNLGQYAEARATYEEMLAMAWLEPEDRRNVNVELSTLDERDGDDVAARQHLRQAVEAAWQDRRALADAGKDERVKAVDEWLQMFDPEGTFTPSTAAAP